MRSERLKIVNATTSLAAGLLLLCGCEKQYLANDGYVPEIVHVEAKENKKNYFFGTSGSFELTHDIVDAIVEVLKKARSTGVDNIGFRLISDRSIPLKIQENLRKQLSNLMCRHGFLRSRIVDSGTCIYRDAKAGIRIEVLTYDVKEPDCSLWSEYIGDIDTNKHLPKFGAAYTYGLLEQIANKADLVTPRKYRGQDTLDAIAAAKAGSSSSGGGGSSSPSSSASAGSSGS
ncbi:MAG: CpaD family pilus assembly lipoprotein [Holosporaceae bacterium]|jgi:type IV pilus biogenesis protein CpaD/CtpE|nr:CpaD family pilus assembly lipoprotein [Holosporaceae bacterium]